MNQSLPESRAKLSQPVQLATNNDRVYWPQLDGLRSLAFLLVFISHLTPLKSPNAGLLPDSLVNCINVAMSWGWIGVELFFVLSAFLITTLLLQERKKYGKIAFQDFLIRRVLRIWPLYYGFIALAFFLIPSLGSTFAAPLGSLDWQLTLQHYLGSSLMFLFNFSLATDGPHLPTFFQRIHWSVAMEEQFYLIWGFLLCRIQKTATLLKVAALGLVGTAALRGLILQETHNYHAYYYNTFSHLDSILVGILIAASLATEQLTPQHIKKVGAILFWGPITLYLGLCLFAPPIQSSDPIYAILLTLISLGCGAFMLAALHGQTGTPFFSHPLLVRFGRLTYATYLFHLLCLEIAMYLTERWAGPINSLWDLYLAWAFYVLLGLFLTWLSAFASWHVLEKRFYDLRYRFSRIPSGFGANPQPKQP